jgi:phosphatidylserine decarboxylase
MQPIPTKKGTLPVPVTPYGLREFSILTLAFVVVAIGARLVWPGGWPWVQIAAAAIWAFGVAFFRDPARDITQEAGALLAPADGTITDIVEVDEPEFLKGRAVRIGIFLSIFSVHINRVPCGGKVAYIQAHPGKCLNAMRAAAASAENAANSLGLECPEHPAKRLMVKQITGAIARRIVCGCKVGDELEAGERYGMIKFGSRTELFVPVDKYAQVVVSPGDKVSAGLTILVRYGLKLKVEGYEK